MAKLAEKLANIANRPTNKDWDPEDNDLGLPPARTANASSDDEDLDSDTQDNSHLQQSHYVKMNASKLRPKKSTVLNAEKYSGAKGSRAELFESSEGEGPSDDDSVDESGDESGDEDQSVDQSDPSQNESDEESQLQLRAPPSVQRDAVKGLSILNQSKLFDNIIDTRIKLQKALNAANTLPLTQHTWKSHLHKKNKKLLSTTRDLLNKVLSQLVDFRNEFQTTDHITTSKPLPANSNKRSFSQLAEDTSVLDNNLSTYRNVVLYKWSTKIQSASGKSALSSTKFKAINQSADVQVTNQLADMTRALKRTRLNRRSVVPLGFQDDLQNNRLSQLSQIPSSSTSQDATSNDLDIPENYDPRRKDNLSIDTTENPYIFDDEDFYRVLLNDLVDKKISNSQSFSNATTIAITSRKLKKNIDTKASKGRKLNYSIQEPIANFEAPVAPHYKWSDEQIDEFFAGLLGQRVNFNEEDSQEDDPNDEPEAIVNDDIQIFG
ncbi:hypothetical protein TBLA_0A02910 [Henningerozyma blattae CBS 6284]|uniref:Protein BFR2 n=1 Tax=Henningerozyma blattae (strain ATCC 34711 / CBS 6284 / DSM 70876 / NBRC 10599 / NRRL Y-10934 / UCD 77-7) TaxID=1071380 RepID=I2GVD9_HENB6|nr:hypothetical protein TBLA_0A02910 [Tetrapisispora blattae CBS 6284]CCH58091.1 hypothetical protein TBLA_0A02910 [Tetrapisispora blattae CBS 6284]